MAIFICIRRIRETDEYYVYEFYEPELNGGKSKRGEIQISRECGKVTVIAMDDKKWLNTAHTGRALFKLIKGFKKGELKPVMDWIS
ncbi:MAG: hypothetical protein ABFD69_02165 [Candidatus Sumerlaeia bacterium]